MVSRRFALPFSVSIFLNALFLLSILCVTSIARSPVSAAEEKEVEVLATIQGLTEEGIRHQKAGQFETAYEKYRAVFTLVQEAQVNPAFSVAPFLGLTSVCVQLGRWQEAVEASQQMIRIQPDFVESYVTLGLAYQNLGRPKEAVEAYQQAIRIKSDHAQAYHGLGMAHQDLGHSEEAIKAYQQALRIQPGYTLAHHGLGIVHRGLGHYQKAAGAFKEAIRLQPDYVLSHLELALTYHQKAAELRQQGNYGEAINFGKQALAASERIHGPDHPDALLFLNELAFLYREIGEHGKSAPLYERALAIQEKTLSPDSPDIAAAIDNLAAVYFDMGEYEKALPLRHRLLAIQEKIFGEDHPNTGATFNNTALLYDKMGEYTKALQLYQRALMIDKIALGSTHPTTATVLSNLAGVHRKMGNYEEAALHSEQALAIKEKTLGSEHPDTAISLTNLVVVYRDMGEYKKALSLSQQALTIFEKKLGPLHPTTATALDNLAAVYFDMGEYEKALSFHQKALMIREKVLGADHPDTATTLANLGAVHHDMGNYAKALSFYERALASQEKTLGPDHSDTVDSLSNMAVLLHRTGDYAGALQLAQRVRAGREKVLGFHHPGTALALGTLAAVHETMGNYTKALSLSQHALAIREKVLGSDHPDTAQSLSDLAAVYNSVGEYPKALALHQRALTIREKALGSEHPDVALSLSNLASSYAGTGRYVQALPLYQRALMIYEKALGPDHPSTALSMNNLASLYLDMGEDAKALPLLKQALMIYEKALGPDHLDTINPLGNLAVVLQSVGDYAKVLQLARRVLDTEDRVLTHVFSFGSENQKLQFIDKLRGSYWTALSLIQRHFPKDVSAVRFGLELVLQRKGIVLDSQSRAQKVLAANLQGDTRESWQRLTQQRSVLSRLLLTSPEKQNPEDYRKRIEALQADIAREEEFLAQQSGLVAQELAQRQVTAEMLAGRLPKDGALIEFVRITDWSEDKKKWAETERYLAFILTPDNQVVLVDLGEARKIDTKIQATLAAINPPDFGRAMEQHSQQADTELTELYQLILQPLEKALGVRKRLIISPDGELNRVPFAALRTPDGRYLVEQMTVSYVTSGRDLLRGTTEVSPSIDLLLVANPAFDNSEILQIASAPSEDAVRAANFGTRKFTPLPGTAEEARIIPPLVTGSKKVIEGKEATETAIHAVKTPKVLHLATHGFFLKDEDIPLSESITRIAGPYPAPARINPMVRSGLALAGANHASTVQTGDDGLLTALEVSGMNLYGTDLAVLSACETAAGDVRVGEGVYGLRRAFVLAGAKNLVMSLWPVGDRTTHRQMEVFYKAYGQGKTPAEALRQAQLQTLASLRAMTATLKEPLTPVKLWAPFIVQQTGSETAG